MPQMIPSAILVVETDRDEALRVAEALGAEGLQADVCASASEALGRAAMSPPRLVVTSSHVPEARALLGRFARPNGGPGSLVLLAPELANRPPAAFHADAALVRPFADDELRRVVRRMTGAAEPQTTSLLSSAEIFGDLLEEVEAAVEDLEERVVQPTEPPLPPQSPARPPPATLPSAAVTTRLPIMKPDAPATLPSAAVTTRLPIMKPGAPTAGLPPNEPERPVLRRRKADDDIDRRLEKTLSGVLPGPQKNPGSKTPAKPSAAATQRLKIRLDGRSEVDNLLEKTLSTLELPTRPRRKKTSKPESPAAPTPPSELPPEPPSPFMTTTLPVMPTAQPPKSEPVSFKPPDKPQADPTPLETLLPGRSSELETDASADFHFEAPPPLEVPPLPAEPAAPIAEGPTPGSAAPVTPVTSLADLEIFRTQRLPAVKIPQEAADEAPEPDSKAPDPPALEIATPKALAPDLKAPEPPALETATPEALAPDFNAPELPALEIATPEAAALELTVPEPPSLATTAGPPAAGQPFGDYTLLERIAVGGMAEVWQARRRGVEGFQKTVAIKRILSHLTSSPDFVTMFIDEAKLAAELNHANIIQIYDLGKAGEDFFIAMEFVDGLDLRSILTVAGDKRQPLPLGLALFVAASVARALDFAHRKRDHENREMGLVHRDISPQNVLISYEGEIKLCDFGIAKAVVKASVTQIGALKGKLQYMSPEQAQGDPVDARSDIFSLGAVLFEMLTGRRLFAGDSELGVLEAVRNCHIQGPRELVPEVPERVDRIVRRALAKEPADRYPTAGEMEENLKAALGDLRPVPGQSELASYLQRLAAAPEADAAPDSPAPPASAPLPAGSATRVTIAPVEDPGLPADHERVDLTGIVSSFDEELAEVGMPGVDGFEDPATWDDESWEEEPLEEEKELDEEKTFETAARPDGGRVSKLLIVALVLALLALAYVTWLA